MSKLCKTRVTVMPRKKKLTVVGVGFDAKAVLHATNPRALVAGSRHGAMTDAVATLVASCPLTVVDPPTVGLPPESVASTVRPFSDVRVTCEPVPLVSRYFTQTCNNQCNLRYVP